jgi:small subunit ribosomal protein S20
MANIASAKKRIRRTARQTEVNRQRRGRVRSFIKQVEAAVESGDKEAAVSALRAAQPEIMRGAGKGIMHKNTASRKVSRLTRRVKALSS